MTGTFSPDSAVATALLQDGRCLLHFQQGRQSYCIPCDVEELQENAAAYQATYWHNHLFNASLPPKVRLLAFCPDWTKVSVSTTSEEPLFIRRLDA